MVHWNVPTAQNDRVAELDRFFKINFDWKMGRVIRARAGRERALARQT
jgi:hypothetical protein